MANGAELPEVVLQQFLGALITVSLDGTVRSWSEGARMLFGYTAQEAVGSSLTSLVVPPTHHGDADSALRSVIATGTTAYEALRTRKDGSHLFVEIAQRLIPATPGHEAIIAINKRDITVLKYVRDANQLEARFRGLLEAAPDAMIIVDRLGRIVLANSQAQRLFRYERMELIGQPIELLVPERFRAHHDANRTSYMHSPQQRPMGAGFDLYGRRKDGTEFPAEISLSPMDDPSGPLATAAIRDVSERREQYRRIQEANRLKSEFLANMSHELRTPLNAIVGFAQLMHDGKVGPVSDRHREYLGDILTSSTHLLQLINDVLDLSKVESGKLEFNPEYIDLKRVAQEVCDVLRNMASTRHLSIVTHTDATIGQVLLDPAKVKLVLYNFLSNAMKFSNERAEVTVRITPEGPAEVRIEVNDSGIGIREEDIGRLFVEFQQLDAGASKQYQGTGLGLALTKRVVEAQGGRVGVASVVGKGSTFFAVLPREYRGGASEPSQLP